MLKSTIDANQTLQDVYVTGEISNLVFNKSGHVYFSLKDEASTISCMIWKTNAEKLRRLKPSDGMKINVVGKVDYYVPYGKVSLVIHDVQVEGIGELQIIFEQRKNELEQAGWFDRSLKKPLPLYPTSIGIVTADTGAAIHDLITTIKRRWPITNIFLFPAKVQGVGASNDLAQKIVQANNFFPVLDVLIVGRGGGSYEDLWEFNEMPVLSAIKNSQIPVISAVGHEPDITLCDYVADKRAATPTAAGELATPNIQELKQSLNYKLDVLKKEMQRVYKDGVYHFSRNTQNLVHEIKNLVHQNDLAVKNNFANLKNNLVHHQQKASQKLLTNYQFLTINLKNLFQKWDQKVQNDWQTFQVLNPMRPLSQGYALLAKNGKILSSNDQVLVGDQLNILRQNDEIKTTVTTIKKRSN